MAAPSVTEKTYSLGRNPDNDIRIDKPQVSGHHATLTTVSDNLMLLEDHDSTNGTFVNGLRVQRALIDPADKILLGNVPLNLSKLFERHRPAESVPKLPAQNNDYTTAFTALREVHQGYLEARKALQRNDQLKVIGRALLVFIPHIGMPLGILMSGLLTNNEKVEVLDREFQLKYACPKCKRYLGNVFWETLATQKRCGCGAVWVAN